DMLGVTISLADENSPLHESDVRNISDAKSVCELQNTEHRAVDLSREFSAAVKNYFVRAYLSGETPNPCVMCNPSVKFAALCAEADCIGADTVATGHYAQLKEHPCGLRLLWDDGSPRDQSYMLARLGANALSRCRFPLGGLSKEDVRGIARKLGISVAERPDSMEICFIPDNDYAAFVERTLGVPPEGDFVDAEGNVLGRHRGIHRYTVGQRKGLGIALGYPAYVSRIDAEQNRVVLAAAGGEYRQEIVLRDCLWHAPMPAVFDAQVKVRHTKRPAAARVTLGEENRAEITFAEPVRAPAPGQTAAIQQEGFVIGCGYIGDAEG
ncbi:MAG: tRNA 2-thiouridine(34) synthase MnmA, partial [Clostridia bacterium]|nr:tRNA 2-thiouridine(34) synthase MnmA [Clostridia bacterium]